MSEVRDRIVKLHGEPTLRRSALRIRGGAGVFEHVLSGKGYRTVLEIGTYRGCAAAEIAQFCERVITVDLERGKLEANGETWDRAAFWSSLGISNIALLRVKDDAHKKVTVDALDFDFAFIDGAHDRTVADDFALVKRCRRVLFHDADDNRLRERKPGASNCIFEFISSLPKEQVQSLDIFALWESR